jgi:SAM-dependent methyltransferase
MHSTAHWNSIYSSDPIFFGEEASILARKALPFLQEYRCKSILELGCGQGRDAIFFAKKGFDVRALDCSEVATSQLKEAVARSSLEKRVSVRLFDLSKNCPSRSEVGEVQAIYSHLFLCMPFNDLELRRLYDFAYDILPENGLHIFSIRDKKKDASYGKGKKLAKDTFEIRGFEVRFFEKSEILNFNRKFKLLEVTEADEQPCSLILVFSVKAASASEQIEQKSRG